MRIKKKTTKEKKDATKRERERKTLDAEVIVTDDKKLSTRAAEVLRPKRN